MRSPPPSQAPRLFDRALLRRRLDRAAPRFAEADFLKRRAAEDLVDRLADLMRPFPLAVDLGARTGVFRQALEASPARELVGVLVDTDPSLRMLSGDTELSRSIPDRDRAPAIVLDEERLPFRPASLDLVVSTLALHATNDLVGSLIQIRRSLRPGGLFLGAMFGGGTLFELRRALMTAEQSHRGGAGLRVAPFADPQDVPSLLQRAGFKDVSVAVDSVTVRYSGLAALTADLRRMGESSVLVDRTRRPLSRALLAEAEAVYAAEFGTGGRLPATFDILLMTGWAPPRPS